MQGGSWPECFPDARRSSGALIREGRFISNTGGGQAGVQVQMGGRRWDEDPGRSLLTSEARPGLCADEMGRGV